MDDEIDLTSQAANALLRVHLLRFKRRPKLGVIVKWKPTRLVVLRCSAPLNEHFTGLPIDVIPPETLLAV